MADRYAVSGGGNWNSTGTWSATSGGSSGASFPVAGDNVFLDSNSGNVVVNTTSACATLDCTGYTGTLSGSGALTVDGNLFKLVPGMTYTRTGTTTFTSTSTVLLTTAGKNLAAVTQNCVGGGIELQDNLQCEASAFVALTVTAGHFDANDMNVTVRAFVSSNANVRTITMGSGLWRLTASSGPTTIWTTSNSTNLTFNKNTADIEADVGSGVYTFIGGGLTFNDVSFAVASGNAKIIVSSASVFAGMSLAAPLILELLADQTASTLEFDGTSATSRVVVVSSAPGTQRAVTLSSGTVEADFLILQDFSVGSGTLKAGRHSIDLGGNHSSVDFESTPTHEVTHATAGMSVTNNNSGSPLGSCDLILMKDIGGGVFEVVSHGTSDGSGEFTLDAYDDDPHFVVARKDGGTNVMDVSDYVTPDAA